jgi:hypothetical protein
MFSQRKSKIIVNSLGTGVLSFILFSNGNTSWQEHLKTNMDCCYMYSTVLLKYGPVVGAYVLITVTLCTLVLS